MAPLDSKSREALIDTLGFLWIKANDKSHSAIRRRHALRGAERIFQELGERRQAELMQRFDISTGKIDQLDAELRDDIRRIRRGLWYLFWLIAACSVALNIYLLAKRM